MLPTGTALVELRLLAALWIASHEPGEPWMSQQKLHNTWHLKIDERLWNSLIEKLRLRGTVDVAYDQFEACAKLADYAGVKGRLERAIGATLIDVSWQFGRITTDATEPGFTDILVCPTGWQIATIEPDPPRHPSPPPATTNVVPIPEPIAVPSQAAVKEAEWLSHGLPIPPARHGKPIEGIHTKASTWIGLAGLAISVLGVLIALHVIG